MLSFLFNRPPSYLLNECSYSSFILVTVASGPFEMDLVSLSLGSLEGEELWGLGRWLMLKSPCL